MAKATFLSSSHAAPSDPVSGSLVHGGSRQTWINGARWDVGLLIGSALIVPVVLFFVWQGASSDAINLGVTAVIGGPHLWATYLLTYADPRFRKRHRKLLLAAIIVVPACVCYLASDPARFQILLSIFIFAASFHVLQQNAYLTDIYRKRSGLTESVQSRMVDYGLLFTSIYPIATYKLVHGTFMLGDIKIIMPEMLLIPATYKLVWFTFAFFLAAWLIKTWNQYKGGVLNKPKTLLIAVTSTIAFFVPAAAEGERLELAFQSVNAWHSIQYMGIIWFVLKVRKDRGLLENRFVRAISGGGKSSYVFYGTCVVITLAMFGVVLAAVNFDVFGFEAASGNAKLASQQYYYMGVLSALLIHYVIDGYFFAIATRGSDDLDEVPYAAPVFHGR